MVKDSTNINKTNNCLSPQPIKKTTMTYGAGNRDPGLGQVLKCGDAKPVNEI